MKTNKLLDYKFIQDILYYDGPLLSLGILQDGTPVLQIWSDCTDEYNLYAYAFMRPDDLQPFLNVQKDYYSVLQDSLEIILFKYNEEAYDFQVISNQKFIEQYGPKPGFALEDDLLDFKERHLTDKIWKELNLG